LRAQRLAHEQTEAFKKAVVTALELRRKRPNSTTSSARGQECDWNTLFRQAACGALRPLFDELNGVNALTD
jgi:hypothetical protein